MTETAHFWAVFVEIYKNFVILHKNRPFSPAAGRYFDLSRGLAKIFSKTFFPKGIDKIPEMWYNNSVERARTASPYDRKELTKMRNIKLFEREINLIVNEDLRMAVKSYMDEATPDYFWTDGASSSGKYHPAFSQGVGGLVRHTKAVVMFAEELLRMSSYAYMREDFKDYVIAACLLHDTAKYGIEQFDKSEYKNHARNAAKAFKDYAEQVMDFTPSEYLLDAMASHMGQWSTEKEDRPFTSIDRCVHMADYMASRSFIDIPSISEEYDEIVNNELPF